MYRKQQLERLKAECEQMVRDIDAVIAEANTQTKWEPETQTFETYAQWPFFGGTRATGAMRRHSMDLTRSLAEMRKP